MSRYPPYSRLEVIRMRVWVTREEEPGGPLSAALTNASLSPVIEPVLERRVVSDLADAVARLTPNDWLVLTSTFAIAVVAGVPARVPCVAVVGEQSARAARAKGFRVELVSAREDAESLFDELRTLVVEGRVLYARSSLAHPPDPWAKVELISPVLYETVAREFDRTVIERVDVVSVASPSAVHAIGPVDLPFASIGPHTSAALLSVGITPQVEASDRSFEFLAAAIAAHAREVRHDRA